MSEEQWLPVVGYEGLYEVSSEGRVRSLDRWIEKRNGSRCFYRGTLLKPGRTESNHLFVVLPSRNGGPRVNARVHRLVLEAFVGPCPEGMEGCHRDDNPTNNHIENLRWDTHSENTLDRVRNGIHHLANKTHCPYGHEYTPENTYIIPSSGGRVCRECTRLRWINQKATMATAA